MHQDKAEIGAPPEAEIPKSVWPDVRKPGLFTIANICCAIAAISVWTAISIESRQTTWLKVSENIHDFGTLKQGDIGETKFILTNSTDDTIEIENVGASCDCSDHTLSSKKIAAHQAATLSVRWDVHGRRGRNQTKLSILYEGPKGIKESQTLQLIADVRPDYDVDPDSSLIFDGNYKETRTITVSPNVYEHILVKKVFSSLDAIRSTIRPHGRQIDVEFDPERLAKNAERGAGSGSQANPHLILETNSPHEPNYRLDVKIKSSEMPDLHEARVR